MAFTFLIAISCIGILFFSVQHFRYLAWNFKKFAKFSETKHFIDMKQSNAEVALMAIPLTLAMSINVIFILVAIFIPGVWLVVEYLFPLALIAFTIVGYIAVKIFAEYMVRLMVHGDFDFISNNNLSQMIAVFAFAMIGVGFAAPAAMSHHQVTATLALIGSLFFVTLTVFFGIIKMVLGFKSIFRQGLGRETSVSIWILIPILTLIGISIIRQQHAFDHTLGLHFNSGSLFILTTIILSLQLIFGYLGYKVMKLNGYFADYIYGKEKSPGSYSLICPGVALFVFGFFFLHLGFVQNGIVDRFSIPYFILLLPLFYLQAKTILVLDRLNEKML